MKRFISSFLLTASLFAQGQDNYIAPSDTLVQQKLAKWKNLKFGLLMHWGTYSQWGVVESWSICPEDEGWTQRKGPHASDYSDYKKAYENLQTTFDPQHFHPEKWAQAAVDAGMRYVVFTTKHHDGFCMFDTRETNYRITSPKTPFSANPRSNIAKEIFAAFRNKGLMTGAYFSKPDWHSPYYWWPYFPPKDRNVNYDPKKYPEKWSAFKQFTFNQIKELMSDYGPMDILWLDGGWVRPLSSVNRNIDWQKNIVFDQDIDMKNIAAMARNLQPGIMIVDRSVGGEYENYQTPEQEVPNQPLGIPWETCMTMGDSWSYVPGDHYKSARDLVQLLIKIVSRGGNLLLNIGPSSDGDWDTAAYARLRDIGRWMNINGEAIYNSKPIAPYSSENVFFTQSGDEKKIYAFYMPVPGEPALPAALLIKGPALGDLRRVRLLGSTKSLTWKKQGPGILVHIPPAFRSYRDMPFAAVFEMTR